MSTPRTASRFFIPLAAAALTGAMLQIGTGTAHAAEEPAFSGFSSSAWSSPIRLEIYEPTIPIPATPQAELDLGYSRVEADSSSSRGRASFLWPGDAVGEGAKTIFENLGLPPEISGPIAEQGYPIQVNSTYPSDQETEATEPFPGTVMNTTATEDKTVASVGYSTNCDVSDAGNDSGGGDDGGGDSPIPGLPPLPGLPGGLGGLGGLAGLTGSSTEGGNVFQGLTDALTGRSSGSGADKRDKSSAQAAEEEAAACQFPPELAALVDLGGYVSTSRSVSSADEVTATSRAALGDVSLLGGIITLSGVNAKAVSSSNGKKTHGEGRAAYGTMSIAGQEFAMGPEGFIAAGTPVPIPGLPDDPAKALEALGITLTLPAPVYEKDGGKMTTVVEGLILDIDTGILRHKLDALPWSVYTDLINQIPFPEDAGPLKSALLSVVTLAPRFVLHLGTATSSVETVQGITIPPIVPDNDPDGEDTGDGDGTGDSGTGGGIPTSGEPPTSTPPGGDSSSTDGDLTDAAPMGAGLPPLFSIPGMLLFGGIAAATVIGSYFRKLGLAALGGGASCPHGLDSGLPDLRKA